MDVISTLLMEAAMLLRNTIFALTAIVTLVTAALAPTSASAGGYHVAGHGHGIIVVCRKVR